MTTVILSDPETPEVQTVWLVDDSPAETERARRVLGERHTVRTFADGPEMLEALGRSPAPDVLIVDWQLPGMTGIELCQFLRSNEPTRSLSILLLTSNDRPEDLAEGLAAGANDYIAKPFRPVELTARVSSLLRATALRKRADRAEEAALTLLRELPEVLLTVNAAGTVIYANAEAERVLEASAKVLQGQPVEKLLPGFSLPRIPEGRDGEVDLPDIKLGSSFYAPVMRPLVLQSSETITISLRDVTVARNQQTRRLDFYSIVAHDLRTPLQAVLLRIDLMQRREAKASAAPSADLKVIQQRLLGLSEMVTDFLELARMDATVLQIEPVSLDLGQLVKSAVADFESLASAKSITLACEAEPVPSISGDPRRLGQVITNLLSNAIKFTPPGGRVDAKVRFQNGQVETAVVDNGRGIPNEALATLFDRYTRVVSNDTVAGTGLGLMIVREIIEAHGGTVGVDSQVGSGSTFWFAIPPATATTAAHRSA